MSLITFYLKRGDAWLFYLLNRKFHCYILDQFMKGITSLGSTVFSIFLPAMLLLLFPIWGWQVGFHTTLTLLIAQGIAQLLKRVINRPRPYRVLENAVALKPPPCEYSFPSGHTCAAFAIALSLTSFYPLGGFIYLPLAMMVGYSRVYLGVHYPTDVLVGFLISLFAWAINPNLSYILFL
jgi:undecaprenyl-diphosphatase